MFSKKETRKVVSRSPKRKVGLINCRWFQNEPIEHESQLEKRFVYCTLLCPQVARIKSQPFTIQIGEKTYTPDFLVTFLNGQSLVVEVKISHRVGGYLDLFNKTEEILSSKQLPFFLLTQNEIDRCEQPRVAAEILRYGKSEFNAVTLQSVLDEMARSPDQWLPIWKLVTQSGACREAVLHLIARRKLILHEDDFIDRDARVRIPPKVQGSPIDEFVRHFEVTPWKHRDPADCDVQQEIRPRLRKKARRSALPYIRPRAYVPNQPEPHPLAGIAGGLPQVTRRRRPGSVN